VFCDTSYPSGKGAALVKVGSGGFVAPCFNYMTVSNI